MIKAVVSGHSRGLGAALCAELLSRGIGVLGLSRNENAALRQRFGGTLEQAPIDLSDASAITRWLAGDPLRQFLRDADTVLLVNNAGAVEPVGPIGAQDPAAIARAVTLNVAAPMMLASAVAGAAPAGCERRILHVSSGAGRQPLPGWSVYCATKAALDQHARAAALDNDSTLRICSLAPGVIDTDMQAAIRASTIEQFPLRERFDAMKRNGDLSMPDDCARRLADYLLGDRFGEVAVWDLRDSTG